MIEDFEIKKKETAAEAERQKALRREQRLKEKELDKARTVEEHVLSDYTLINNRPWSDWRYTMMRGDYRLDDRFVSIISFNK